MPPSMLSCARARSAWRARCQSTAASASRRRRTDSAVRVHRVAPLESSARHGPRSANRSGGHLVAHPCVRATSVELHVRWKTSTRNGCLAAVASVLAKGHPRPIAPIAQAKVDGGVGIFTLAETLPDSTVLGARRPRPEVRSGESAGREEERHRQRSSLVVLPAPFAPSSAVTPVEDMRLVEDAAPIDQR